MHPLSPGPHPWGGQAAYSFFMPTTQTQQVPAERAEDLKNSNLDSSSSELCDLWQVS